MNKTLNHLHTQKKNSLDSGNFQPSKILLQKKDQFIYPDTSNYCSSIKIEKERLGNDWVMTFLKLILL